MPTHNYETRIPQVEKRIENGDISAENKKLIKKYQRDLTVQDYSNARIYKLLTYLKVIAEHIDYSFEEATEEDIKDTIAWINNRDLSDATRTDYRTLIKQFYKWLNDGEYPEKVKWISTTRKKSNNTLPKDVLTEEDIEKLIKNANNTRDKALISMLWETGARIGELIDLTIRDIEDHKHGKKVVIQGKTGARRIPLISSVPHLQTWLNNHPRAEEKDAPLWVNLPTANNNPEKQMRYRTITKQLNKAAKDAGIDKPMNPHHFRHSRATYLASKFTESQLCEWFGWVQGSDRPQDYVHMSGRDIDGDYARLHGIEDEEEPEESQLAPEDCPRCGAKNDPNVSFCQNCGQALTREAFEEVEREETVKEMIIEKVDELDSTGTFDELLEEAVEEKVREVLSERDQEP